MTGGIRQVTALESINRRYVRVWLNDAPAFRLLAEDVRMLGLREGDPVREDQLQQIFSTVLRRNALHRCADLLKQRDKTEYEIRRKLSEEEYPEEVTDNAVSYLKERHYLDDFRYAESYIRLHQDSMSILQLTAHLKSHGVSDDVIRTALEESEPADPKVQIRKLLEKKKDILLNGTDKQRQNLAASLIRRGYAWHDVKEVMDQIRNID